MKKVLISFANEKYIKSQELLHDTALHIGGINEVIDYTQKMLKLTDFYKKNRYILDKPRGAGYWAWKPFIILEAFNYVDEGDIVMYSDSGLNVIGNLGMLFDITERASKEGRMVFRLPHIGAIHQNKIWTKKDCFILTNCNDEKYWNGFAVNGAISLWKKNKENIAILEEWQRYLRDPRIVTDDPNMLGQNDIMFKDHRHDQSVLSLLAIKYDFEIFRDPTQYGNEEVSIFDNSPYPQLFNHHRGNI